MTHPPRYFPPHAENPAPLAEALDFSPGLARQEDLTEVVLEAMDRLERLFHPGPVIQLQPEVPQRKELLAHRPRPRARQEELRAVVCEAMDRLEGCFDQESLGQLQPEAPRSPKPKATIPGLPPLGLGSRGSLAGRWVGAFLGCGLALGAGVNWGHRQRPLPPLTGRICALPTVPLTQVMAGYRMRAELGDATAMRLLATCYEEGLDTPADPREAARWAAEAALARHPGFGGRRPAEGGCLFSFKGTATSCPRPMTIPEAGRLGLHLHHRERTTVVG